MKFPDKKIIFLDVFFLAALLANSIYRDIQLEKQYNDDLRNRVVGSRLQKDGKLPYTYYYKSGDDLRYFDIYNLSQDSLAANNITASPFFHQLLVPICDLPQHTISRIWLSLQYIFLVAIVYMIIGLTKNKGKKWLILNMGIILTTTEAWKILIHYGQLYLFVAFLFCCIITGLISNKISGVILAAVCTIVFVLVRPIGIVFFIPFLFFHKQYISFLALTFTGLIIYSLIVLNDPYEKSLYRNYVTGIKMQVQYHQLIIINPLFIRKVDNTSINKFEGIDFSEVNRQKFEHPIPVYSENGNIYVLYHLLLHKKISLSFLFILLTGTILLLSILFFLHYKIIPPQKLQILIFGFILYMVVELFSPVLRQQYNTVQWFPLVLSGVILMPGWNNRISLLFIAGFILNIVNFPWLPMRHTLGEFCWLAGLIHLVFNSQLKQVAWKKP
jgi:hypothetical protein